MENTMLSIAKIKKSLSEKQPKKLEKSSEIPAEVEESTAAWLSALVIIPDYIKSPSPEESNSPQKSPGPTK